jgi:hypothetical protein
VFLVSCAQPRQVKPGGDDLPSKDNPNRKLDSLPVEKRIQTKFELLQLYCDLDITEPRGSIFKTQTTRIQLWDIREDYAKTKNILVEQEIDDLQVAISADADLQYHKLLRLEVIGKNGSKTYKTFPHTVTLSKNLVANFIYQNKNQKQRDEFMFESSKYITNFSRDFFRKNYYGKDLEDPELSLALTCGLEAKVNPEYQ